MGITADILTELKRIGAAADRLAVKGEDMGICEKTDPLETVAEGMEGIVVEKGTYSFEFPYSRSAAEAFGNEEVGHYEHAISGDAGFYRGGIVGTLYIGDLNIEPRPDDDSMNENGEYCYEYHADEQLNYFAEVKVTVPTQELKVSLSQEEQVFEANRNGFYRKVTVPGIPEADYTNHGTMEFVLEDYPSSETSFDDTWTQTLFYAGDGSGREGYYSAINVTVRARALHIVPDKKGYSYYAASGDVDSYGNPIFHPTSGDQLSCGYAHTVIVDPIPDKYVDTSDGDAAAADILEGKVAFVDGKKVTGTMIRNRNFSVDITYPDIAPPDVIDPNVQVVLPNSGYYTEGCICVINYTNVSFTPTKETQFFSANDLGAFIAYAAVGPIPDNYVDTSDANATAAKLLEGSTAYAGGKKIEGTMKKQGSPVFYVENDYPSDESAMIDDTWNHTLVSPVFDNVGYYSGVSATVRVQSLEVTPGTTEQVFTAGDKDSSGNQKGYIYKVTVAPIPYKYIDTTEKDEAAAAEHILDGKIAYVNRSKITGTMPNIGAKSLTLNTGKTSYKIDKGYHDGNGEVKIQVQSKSCTPSEEAQTVMPDSGYVLESVTVPAIDKSSWLTKWTASGDALSNQILEGKKAFVDGKEITGTMTNHGTQTFSFSYPKDALDYTNEINIVYGRGYYDSISGLIELSNLEVTPSRTAQTITAADKKSLFAKVTVGAIPGRYVDTTESIGAAAAEHILEGKVAHVNGWRITGTMPYMGAMSLTLDTDQTSYKIDKGYHDGNGTVRIRTQSKECTPGEAAQAVTPDSGYVLKSVTVRPVPDSYARPADVDAAFSAIRAKGVDVTDTSPENLATYINLIVTGGEQPLTWNQVPLTTDEGFKTISLPDGVYVVRATSYYRSGHNGEPGCGTFVLNIVDNGDGSKTISTVSGGWYAVYEVKTTADLDYYGVFHFYDADGKQIDSTLDFDEEGIEYARLA